MWSKRKQTAGEAAVQTLQRLLMIPHVHIYFITLHNKCLYNYSYPASTAHFNVNPTKKKKKVQLKKKKKSALQKIIKAACWFWSLTVSLGSPVLRSPAEVQFPSVFVSDTHTFQI